MTRSSRLVAGAVGLALAVAACGGASTGGPGASAATGGPGASAAATAAAATAAPPVAEPTDVPETAEAPEPTGEPGATDDGSGAGDPSFVPGAASDLEAMLPDEAGGMTYQKTSFEGSSLGVVANTIDTAKLDPILKASGKTISDVRLALASPIGGSSADAGMAIAFQIRGLDATRFLEAMGADPTTMARTSVGGKDVFKGGVDGMSVVIYPKGDVLFEVLLASDRVAESIVSQLP